MSTTENLRPIRRALVSVYDKTGLTELAAALHAAGVEILSTGSTAGKIAEAGIPVTPVEDVTGFPECLDGRVKTLHPRIHAGILADRTKETHVAELAELGVDAIDLVVVNLYPFTATVASGADFAGCIEQIDIGGPTMVRAAAKNHASVAIVTNPAAYPDVAAAVAAGGFTDTQRKELAAKAFAHTAAYDAAVAGWFATQVAETPEVVGAQWELLEVLRYGENPHQAGAVYKTNALGFGKELSETGGIANAVQLSGKAMSYNNYTDGDAALRAAYDHAQPCVAIIKHANPCGVAIGADVAEAHRKAHACDPVSAFGGVIAVNRPVSVELANQIAPIFTEVVLAPGYEEGAAEILATKKNLRVLKVVPPVRETVEFKQISGGLVVQDRDALNDRGDDPQNWTLVSGEAADTETLRDLEFAWKAVRAVRSNAILLVNDGASVGVGMGQVNRVDSCTLAVTRANTLGSRSTGDAAKVEAGVGGASVADLVDALPPQRAQGAVAASDAFFPFADGLQILIDAGVRAVVQPGGSIRDEEVIAAAQAAGITMYFTGNRHFSH
ncbi:phosphoribosylaminoimidazolecarboxamide formyltransferase/IMP cyclohydrolase [Gleimia coleocanis DSM 15436]|uniref:Bifunctional purine biosynthesis protein PurH n=1 Tax=Gleimia coleocanis DSM 15436 TaxID=525245 RepID=C0VZJ9_9ACTO|nr:bifunctional phosphoribosylaminoimidazolecarboxamide formyltransferase/IMP cyclohydrolase [Gleimia coleocanis]EEH64118.1 phosphoribosylaminoimidazolecarboxamide formyltransferase/IMP cyclohydrolase [Gleimia coleocanis DSM 15436]